MSQSLCLRNNYFKALSYCCGHNTVGQSLSTRNKYENEDRLQSLPQMVPTDHQWIDISPKCGKNTRNATHFSLNSDLIRRRLSSPSGSALRGFHSDLKIPDFTQYRRRTTRDVNQRNDASVDTRRAFTYVMTGGVGVGAAIVAKAVVQSCVSILSPAKDVLALAKIEVDLSQIPEGKNLTVKWRGKPVFVRRRTAEEVARERAVDVSQLRDPESDESRCPSGQWLVVVGVCTHLGCVPIANAGDYGGYYCPCHGSHYDASGRIRKGPAPLNLEVPEHELDGNSLVVG